MTGEGSFAEKASYCFCDGYFSLKLLLMALKSRMKFYDLGMLFFLSVTSIASSRPGCSVLPTLP